MVPDSCDRFPTAAKYDSLPQKRCFAAQEDRMGAAVKITRVDHTPNQLRAIAARSEDGGQARRLLALALVLEGTSRADVAR